VSTVLNVGCGEDLHSDAINIDLRPVGDLVADVTDLPYQDGSVDELRALDVLEHFSEFDYPSVLTEWARVLKPGGRLIVRVPNLYALCVQIAARADRTEGVVIDLIRNLMGGHKFGLNGELDTHHWNFTPATLAQALIDHGFRIDSNDQALNQRVEAVKR
jgi:SAM-dependent methyltransferase